VRVLFTTGVVEVVVVTAMSSTLSDASKASARKARIRRPFTSEAVALPPPEF